MSWDSTPWWSFGSWINSSRDIAIQLTNKKHGSTVQLFHTLGDKFSLQFTIDSRQWIEMIFVTIQKWFHHGLQTYHVRIYTKVGWRNHFGVCSTKAGCCMGKNESWTRTENWSPEKFGNLPRRHEYWSLLVLDQHRICFENGKNLAEHSKRDYLSALWNFGFSSTTKSSNELLIWSASLRVLISTDIVLSKICSSDHFTLCPSCTNDPINLFTSQNTGGGASEALGSEKCATVLFF